MKAIANILQSKWFFIGFVLLILILISQADVGTWGLNKTVGWAWDLTNLKTALPVFLGLLLVLTYFFKHSRSIIILRTVLLLFFALSFLAGCQRNPSGKRTTTADGQKRLDMISYGKTAQFCDSCVSTLVVEHMECTECKDLLVDSGTVFITAKILRQIELHLAKDSKKGNARTKLNAIDLYFEDPTDFKKLWGDTISWKNWGRKYRVKGSIAKYDKGALYFKMDAYEILDTAYAQTFDRP
ncbi:hypothetical protein [Flavobacterium sp.]|uniref:hypothetical protein n=1 Tax=Flavobacterium sp. TaxID=239 RepID=UPI0039E2C623